MAALPTFAETAAEEQSAIQRRFHYNFGLATRLVIRQHLDQNADRVLSATGDGEPRQRIPMEQDHVEQHGENRQADHEVNRKRPQLVRKKGFEFCQHAKHSPTGQPRTVGILL